MFYILYFHAQRFYMHGSCTYAVCLCVIFKPWCDPVESSLLGAAERCILWKTVYPATTPVSSFRLPAIDFWIPLWVLLLSQFTERQTWLLWWFQDHVQLWNTHFYYLTGFFLSVSDRVNSLKLWKHTTHNHTIDRQQLPVNSAVMDSMVQEDVQKWEEAETGLQDSPTVH